MKKIFFHGFLGNANQFTPLIDEHSFVFPIDDYIDSNIDQITTRIKKFLDGEVGHLIGYSFGSRMAMQVYCHAPQLFNKLILLTGHAGIDCASSRQSRLEIEESFVEKLNDFDKDNFKKFWNSLDLFCADHPIEISHYSPKHLQKYFINWGLSKQPYLLESLKQHKENVFWFFGEQDKKYSDYAKRELSDFNVKIFPGLGHRVYQSEDLLNHISELL